MTKYIYQEKAIQVDSKNYQHPRFAQTRNLSTTEFIERAVHGNRETARELATSITRLADALAEELATGHSITLQDIGTFSPTLEMREDRTAVSQHADGTQHKSNAQSIQFGTVRFTPAKSLISNSHTLCQHLEHDTLHGDSHLTTRHNTTEKRIRLLMTHLQDNPVITITDYMHLTGLSKTSARRELQKLQSVDNSILRKNGTPPHVFYTKLP